MTMVLSLASTHMKMTPAEGLTAATVNAAYSLNRGDARLGTLEEGKRADFVVHDCADYRELAYFFGVEHAHAVFVGGRLAYRREGLKDCPAWRVKIMVDAQVVVVYIRAQHWKGGDPNKYEFLSQ